MTEVLSFGAGVNSTSLLVLQKQGRVKFDLAIFADTGSELPETYQYIDSVVKPLCTELKLPFVTVGSPTLYEDYWKRKIIPFRLFRSCTDRYKIRPIHKYLKSKFSDYTTTIGFASDESERAKYSEDFHFPLIDLGITRLHCINLIANEGLPIPVKSGCYFCPHQPLHAWQNLLATHKNLFLKAEAFEKNCRSYPQNTLSPKHSLHQIREALENQTRLLDWQESEGCMRCHQ